MQVIADKDFPAVRECQVLQFRKGEVISGDLARYLVDSGAPVSEPAAAPSSEKSSEGRATRKTGRRAGVGE